MSRGLKNRRFELNLSKITRPVATIKSVRFALLSLQWRHNYHNCVSNHQPHDCSLKRLFGRRSKKTWKLCVTGLCAVNSPEAGEFPAQMISNAENVSISWRHHASSPARKVSETWGMRYRVDVRSSFYRLLCIHYIVTETKWSMCSCGKIVMRSQITGVSIVCSLVLSWAHKPLFHTWI